MKRPRRIALVAGATAGHLAPAVAVADALRRLAPEVECLLLLPRTTVGSWILDGTGLCIEPMKARPFYGAGLSERMALPFRFAASILDVHGRLRARGVSLVLAFGGFGTVDAAFAARRLGIPVFLHESNARGGLSTRLAARLAERVFLGEEAAAGDFPAGRTTHTGTPVRAAYFDVPARRLTRHRDPTAALRILVVGGSGGSEFLDRRFPATAARAAHLGLRLHVTHLGGGGDAASVERAYRAANITANVLPHVRDMADALLDCDFVVSRAGASSLGEIAASGTASLFVPLSGHARDHQTANLVAASRHAPLWWIREEHWDDDAVAGELVSRLRDRRLLAEAGAAMHTLASADCASRIAEACLARLARVPA